MQFIIYSSFPFTETSKAFLFLLPLPIIFFFYFSMELLANSCQKLFILNPINIYLLVNFKKFLSLSGLLLAKTAYIHKYFLTPLVHIPCQPWTAG